MKKDRKIWFYIAAAVLVCAAIAAVVVFAFPSGARYKTIEFDATESPEVLSGSSFEYILEPDFHYRTGSPPAFEFPTNYFIVKAKVVENYEDVYSKLNDNYQSKYRLIKMETFEVIRGENIPQKFFYVIPDYLYTDLSVYDSLLISMAQLGTEKYTIENKTQQRVEALEYPVFEDYQEYPALGSIIAFTDGVFDDSLWRSKPWAYGYRFADRALTYHVVKHGASESDVIARIYEKIEEDKEWMGDDFRDRIEVLTLDAVPPEAKEALEFVLSFENGVFCQSYWRYHEGGRMLVFTRYINGCETEETVTINLDSGAVIHSDIRYTEEDMSQMENITAQLALKAEEYFEELPTPPRTNPAGKELLSLGLNAWYVKVDGKLYGVVKTTWNYAEKDNRHKQYYDDSYTLYDMSERTAAEISSEDLLKIVGSRHVYEGDYGAIYLET